MSVKMEVTAMMDSLAVRSASVMYKVSWIET